jgi:hypothetical protein
VDASRDSLERRGDGVLEVVRAAALAKPTAPKPAA